MVSSSTIPYVADMAELRANGLGVPLLFPVDAQGFATISSLHLSIRFKLQNTSVWIEGEVCDPVTLLVTHTIPEVPSIVNDGLAQNETYSWQVQSIQFYNLTNGSAHAVTNSSSIVILHNAYPIPSSC